MKRIDKSILVAAVAGALGAAALSGVMWTGELKTARQETAAAVDSLHSALGRSRQLQASADSLREAATRRDAVAESKAIDAARRLNTAMISNRAMIARWKADSTDVAEVVFEAEKALTEAEATAEGWHSAYVEQKAATGLLEAANDSLVAALAAVTPAAERAADAATNLVRASSPPGFFSRLAPNVGVGVAVGVDLTGRPNAVVGVTVGWRLR